MAYTHTHIQKNVKPKSVAFLSWAIKYERQTPTKLLHNTIIRCSLYGISLNNEKFMVCSYIWLVAESNTVH